MHDDDQPTEAGGGGQERPTQALDRLSPGATLGRYVVLERIGSGGMGVVYAVYDRELGRKVALKVLHGHSDERSGQRLLREAQAMAKLAHPNVVAVHDVGEHVGHTFIAMEFIEGLSLDRWLVESERSWRDVVGVFLQAGQGLAAAHRAGLVHRDFKPGNVLVGRDGRARVVDFGLARPVEWKGLDDAKTRAFDATTAAPSTTMAGPATPLTQPGAIVGTPRYMAPEQVLEGRADARSDQFAFCVALYEALWGEHPLPGDGFSRAIQHASSSGIGVPASPRIPARVRRAIARGLAPRPSDRFPDMGSLLAELGHDPATLRRKWALAGGIALLAAALILGAMEIRRRRAALCSGGTDRLQAVWNPRRMARIEASFAATGLPGAGVLAERVGRALDARGAHWVDCFTRACTASRLRGEVSPEVLDRQVACLELRLAETDAFVSLLETADTGLAVSGLDALRGLPDPEPCTSAAELLGEDPLPADPVRRQAVKAGQAELARAEALHAAGRYDAAARLAAELVQAGGVEYQPLLASALLLEGKARTALGETGMSEPLLRKALVVAERGGASRVASMAAERMAWSLTTVRADTTRAFWWLDLAEARASRLLHGASLRRTIQETRVTILQQAGRYEDALALERRLLAEAREAGGTAVQLAVANEKLADVLFSTGAYDEAIELYRKAVALRERDLGPEHPLVADPLVSLGAALSKGGRADEAVGILERALSIEESAYGTKSPLLGQVLNNIAYVQEERGRNEEALATYDKVLEIVGAGWGPGHPQVGLTQINRTSVLRRMGRLGDALDAAGEAQRVLAGAYGLDHPYTAYAFNSQGVILYELKRYRDAAAAFERALRIRENVLTDPLETAETRFSLAKALCATGERTRARAEARRARRVFVGRGGQQAGEDLRRYEDWARTSGCR
ncbi:MAG: serine/threonine protein kinase [Acidobacteria bacterium]|nr:serine/threonine protein kinase [Acidobacteriota bacterium]